jgi:NTE family protein
MTLRRLPAVGPAETAAASPGGQRRGLVLGAGGVLGAAWMIGSLSVLEDRLGFDARTAEVIVGTSAGSVLAAMLGSGVGVDTLLAHQRGQQLPEGVFTEVDADTAGGGALPPRPRFGIGSTALLARAALTPRRFPPLAAFSAVLPHGRADLRRVGALVGAASAAGQWASHPSTWVVAMDYDRGRRVAFGRAGAPPAALDEAVMASCAIPGWYSPVVINGRRYVDGGTCSPTSLDLLAGQGLDEVVVLAPMTAFEFDDPPSLVGRLERRFRRAVTRRMLREAEKVRARGTRVTLLAPGRKDLEHFGVNLMDPRRRRRVLEGAIESAAASWEAAAADQPVAEAMSRPAS